MCVSVGVSICTCTGVYMSAQENGDGGSKRSVWTRVNAGGGAGGGSCRSVGASMCRSGRVRVFVCE